MHMTHSSHGDDIVLGIELCMCMQSTYSEIYPWPKTLHFNYKSRHLPLLAHLTPPVA